MPQKITFQKITEIIGVLAIILMIIGVCTYAYQSWEFNTILKECINQLEIPFEACVDGRT